MFGNVGYGLVQPLLVESFSGTDVLGFVILVWLLFVVMLAGRGVYLNYKLCWIVRRKHPEINFYSVRAFLKSEEKKGTCDHEYSCLKRAMFRCLIASAILSVAWIFVFFVIPIVLSLMRDT